MGKPSKLTVRDLGLFEPSGGSCSLEDFNGQREVFPTPVHLSFVYQHQSKFVMTLAEFVFVSQGPQYI